jgi:hypothetical protein
VFDLYGLTTKGVLINVFAQTAGSRTEKDQPTTSLEAISTNEEVTLMDSRATPEHRNGVFSPITPYLDNSHE